jgi:hypothetical protein
MLFLQSSRLQDRFHCTYGKVIAGCPGIFATRCSVAFQNLNPSDQGNISGPSPLHRFHGDVLVESCESAVIPNRQGKQISICDLLVTANQRQAEKGIVGQCDRSGPKVMVGSGAKTSQTSSHFQWSCLHR